MSLYRKYRPQKIAELDIEDIRNHLAKVLSSSFIPHAFLFSGPKGTGKTSAARIVAKILNCQKRKTDIKNETEKNNPKNIEPCNTCDVCEAITYGNFLDVLEIDAASNRGIDEIRDLREKIKLAPSYGKYKVYIIDEVHMLTNEAFNALLKTLEEPPPHAIFILATTEPEKLPPTILSRCLKFNFHKGSIQEINHSLQRVASGEKIKVDLRVLDLISETADGSFRDATKLFEQAISEDSLTLEKITQLLGRDYISIESFVELLIGKKTKEALTEIENMSKKGADFKYFISQILNLLHAVILVNHGLATKTNFNLNNFNDKISNKDLIILINLFTSVYQELRYASSPELPLEVAVIEWCEKEKGQAMSVKR